MQDLINAALNLRVATVEANEQGIVQVYNPGTSREEFQFVSKEIFAEMIKNKKYKIKRFDGDYPYKYSCMIDELKFTCLTEKLLFEGDEIND